MQTYQINSPNIVSEVFADEEAAVINLKTGNYYSLNKMGAEIWQMIEKGENFDVMANFIYENFTFKDSFNKTEIEEFIKQLMDEDLIAVAETPASATGISGNVQNSAAQSKDKREYEPPVLECYADMQELLLLDPIHEVEETNWLIKKAQ